jgi:Fe-S-cluster containining protein
MRTGARTPGVVDARGWCDGRCCETFWIASGEGRMTTAEVVAQQASANRFDLGHIVMLAIPFREEVLDGRAYGVFQCREFDEQTFRCKAYASRPFECREFPGRGRCVYCGFSVAKRRRAVKRMIRETIAEQRLRRISGAKG